MTVPTARNMSLPRWDLERTGLFDEQFRSACLLFRLYRAVSALYIMRGVREGLEVVRRREGNEAADRLGRHTRV
jgi:hypothetical protein